MKVVFVLGQIFDFLMILWMSLAGFCFLFKQVQISLVKDVDKPLLMAVWGLMWTAVLALTWLSKILILRWLNTP